jgi:hypothetical protein
MQNRTELQSEYLQLINKLNSSNRKKNQQSELTFIIKNNTDSTQSLMTTVNNEKFLLVGQILDKFYLSIHPDFEYQNLAKYIKESILNSTNNIEAYSTIRLAIHRLFSI